MNKTCPLCGSNAKINLKNYSRVGSIKHGCRIVCCSSCFHYYSVSDEKLNLTELYSENAYKLLNTKNE